MAERAAGRRRARSAPGVLVRCALLACGATLAALPAGAQGRAPDRWEPARLERGSVTRIRIAGRLDFGRLSAATDTSVVLSAPGGDRVYLLSGVDSLWTRDSRAGSGAALGGLVGLAGGAALGALFVKGLCDSPSGCASDYREAVPLGAMFFGFGGAFVGTMVGSLVHVWRLRLPARRRPAAPLPESAP